jgi:hypothetical protein
MASGDVAGGLGTTAGTAAALLAGEGMKVPEPGVLPNADLAQAAIAKQAARTTAVAGPKEPIPGAPLTRGEVAGPGLKQSAEQLASKVAGAQKVVAPFMQDRTAAIRAAADKIAPSDVGAEDVGAQIQNAGRDVLEQKQQAQDLTEQLADRANQELEDKQNAATADQGRAMQESAATELENRRAAGVQGGKDIAKDISGQDELPVPEADRKIIDSLRNANQEAHGEESAAHEALTNEAKARGVTVDPAPMQDVAKNIVQLEGPAKDLVM